MYILNDSGKEKCFRFIAECVAKQKELLDTKKDTAHDTVLPSLADIESDINAFIDENGDYYNAWGVTDNYNSDTLLCLSKEDMVDAKNRSDSKYGLFPTLAEIKRDYAEITHIVDATKSITELQYLEKELQITLEVNGVFLEEYASNKNPQPIEWIRVESYGCLAYIYIWADGAAPIFDVWCNAVEREFISDFTFSQVEEQYENIVVSTMKMCDAILPFPSCFIDNLKEYFLRCRNIDDCIELKVNTTYSLFIKYEESEYLIELRKRNIPCGEPLAASVDIYEDFETTVLNLLIQFGCLNVIKTTDFFKMTAEEASCIRNGEETVEEAKLLDIAKKHYFFESLSGLFTSYDDISSYCEDYGYEIFTFELIAENSNNNKYCIVLQ